ncbi:hypothetical protein IJG76_00285 [Candidatus Saccharibacteria bacterium]|nr:hypothetical protein [Candidatus Saccharibacteria bacterium]
MGGAKEHKHKVLWMVLSALLFVAAVAAGYVGIEVRKVVVDENREAFSLSQEFYESEEGLKEISAEEFSRLVAEKKSFLVLGHTLACPMGMPLTTLVKEFSSNHKILIVSLDKENFEQAGLSSKIKYLPTMVIYQEGEIVKYLDGEKNEDLPAYKTLEGLENWVKKYVKI